MTSTSSAPAAAGYDGSSTHQSKPLPRPPGRPSAVPPGYHASRRPQPFSPWSSPGSCLHRCARAAFTQTTHGANRRRSTARTDSESKEPLARTSAFHARGALPLLVHRDGWPRVRLWLPRSTAARKRPPTRGGAGGRAGCSPVMVVLEAQDLSAADWRRAALYFSFRPLCSTSCRSASARRRGGTSYCVWTSRSAISMAPSTTSLVAGTGARRSPAAPRRRCRRTCAPPRSRAR